jgi:hypothetical protein
MAVGRSGRLDSSPKQQYDKPLGLGCIGRVGEMHFGKLAMNEMKCRVRITKTISCESPQSSRKNCDGFPLEAILN